MSLKAIVWVMEEAPVTNHGHLALLYALADRANDDGQAAWPTQEWLAKRCRVSTRTVRRYLSELEESGIIVRGDQRLVDFIDARRRPVVWDIVMDFRADNSDFRPDKTEDLGRTDCPVKDSWPDNPRQLGRTTGVLQTVLKPSINPLPLKGENGESQKDEHIERSFQEFVNAYPLNTKIVRARKGFIKALQHTTAEELLAEVDKQRELIVLYEKPAYMWLRDSNYLDPLEKPQALRVQEQTERYLEEVACTPPQKPPPNLQELFKNAGRPDLYPKKKENQ